MGVWIAQVWDGSYGSYRIGCVGHVGHAQPLLYLCDISICCNSPSAAAPLLLHLSFCCNSTSAAPPLLLHLPFCSQRSLPDNTETYSRVVDAIFNIPSVSQSRTPSGGAANDASLLHKAANASQPWSSSAAVAAAGPGTNSSLILRLPGIPIVDTGVDVQVREHGG